MTAKIYCLYCFCSQGSDAEREACAICGMPKTAETAKKMLAKTIVYGDVTSADESEIIEPEKATVDDSKKRQ